MDIIDKLPINIYNNSILDEKVIILDPMPENAIIINKDKIPYFKFPFSGIISLGRNNIFKLKYDKKYITILIKNISNKDINVLLGYLSFNQICKYIKIKNYCFITFIR